MSSLISQGSFRFLCAHSPKMEVLRSIDIFLLAQFIFAFPIRSADSNEFSNQSLAVQMRNGDVVEGFRVYTTSGARARAFLGVPFAEPPVGELRFEKTRPVGKSKIPKRISCLAYKSNCWQNHSHIADPITDMSEDCLYLNVFSGHSCEKSKCPVLYYIHGGAFEFDGPSMFPVDVLVENFATHGLVLITIAYRLGVLGFWSLGGEEAMGNYALYDVIEGLKWVQREIPAFGGDPNRVTIMGHSSGATFVSLLSVSPEARGLFQNAVIMSGAPKMSSDLSRYHRLAENVGCARKIDWLSNHRNDKKIVQCMRRVPVDVLVNSDRTYEDSAGGHPLPFLDGPNGLFPLPYDELSKTRPRINAVIGTTKNENGNQIFSYVNATASTLWDMCETKIDSMPLKNKPLLILRCQQRYLEKMRSKDGAIDEFGVWTQTAVDFTNDVEYFAPEFKEAASLADAGGNVFLYSFDFVKKGLEAMAPWHAFDLTYVVGIHSFEFDERDYEIKSIYVPLFVNFAKYGNPTPNQSDVWTPLRMPPLDMNYYSIDLPTKMEKPYHYDAVLFWNYIVPVLGGQQNSESKLRFSPLLNSRATNSTSIDSGTDWYSAFWITFSLLVLISLTFALGVLFLFFRRRSCDCLVRSKRKPEQRTLLASMKNVDSYATFYD